MQNHANEWLQINPAWPVVIIPTEILIETLMCSILQGILLSPGSTKIGNIHYWWASAWSNYIL